MQRHYRMRRIADFASLYQDVPVRMALQIYRLFVMRLCCILTYGKNEILAFRSRWAIPEQMLESLHSWRFEEGYMHPGDEPGLGIL